MATTLLDKLKLMEVSGVDFPASELNGFMVAKAKERAAADSAMAEAIRKTYGLTRDALGRFSSADAPAEAPAEEAPKSLWSHHGAVHESLRAR